MTSLLLVTASLLLLVSGGRAAAVRESVGGEETRAAQGEFPNYDDGFMKKLCAFLGATYVRSVKDPLCWYTWCHNGDPYHMQCPPGRSVSRHFYWSSDDPCTESDAEEQCLLGFLKNMHLDRLDETEVLPLQEDPQQNVHTEAIVTGEVPADERDHGEVYVEGHQAAVKPELQEELMKEVVEEERVESELEPEPVPEPEPIPEIVAKPQIIVQRIEEPEEEDGMYYPGHRRAHIVESFVPQSQEEQLFLKHTDHYPYYTPRVYFPHHPAGQHQLSPQPVQYHAEQQLHQLARDQPHVEYLPQADLPQGPVTSKNYRTPEGRQAPLNKPQEDAEKDADLREQLPEDEPLYDAEYLGSEFTSSPTEEKETGVSPDTTEYVFDDSQQVAAPQKVTEAVTEPPPREQGEAGEERSELEISEEMEEVQKWNDEEPMVYDYFKTHFVEEI